MTAPQQLAFAPIRLLDVEVAQPLPALAPAHAPDGSRYRRAQVLVRCHTLPLGHVDVVLPGGTLAADELAARIEASLGAELRAHLAADGLASPPLTAAGVATPAAPGCLRERRRVLADAPAVTVVVPTRGRPELATRCVASVLASAYPPARVRVVLVDNAPPDTATRDAFEQSFGSEPRARYVRCDTPGSAAARNAGIALAEGELVAIADDDVLVDEHWLAELAGGFADPATVCVTGAILPRELDTPAQHQIERFGGFHKGFAEQRWSIDQPPAGDPLFPFAAGRYGSGANLAFRLAPLRALGGYDPRLGNGTRTRAGEDFELMLRTVRSGGALVYRPSAIVRHLHRRDAAALARVIESYGVAVTATLTRTIAHDPRAALEIARRLPPSFAYVLSSKSAKNAQHAGSFPLSLRLRELRGMTWGPLAYFASCRAVARAEAR